jgi:hypothetical protein
MNHQGAANVLPPKFAAIAMDAQDNQATENNVLRRYLLPRPDSQSKIWEPQMNADKCKLQARINSAKSSQRASRPSHMVCPRDRRSSAFICGSKFVLWLQHESAGPP